MDMPEQINRVIFAEKDWQLVKLWQWEAAVYDDEENGIFQVLLRGNYFNDGEVSTFINPDGRRLTPLEFDYVDQFHNGVVKVAVKGKGYGYMNTAGEMIIPMIYEDAGFFHDNFSHVKKNGVWMLIDRNGKEIALPREYKDFGWMSNSRCRVSTLKIDRKDLAYYNDYEHYAGLWGFVDESGKEIIEPQYIYAMDFEEGLAVVCKGEWQEEAGKYLSDEELWGVIDVNGKEIIPCQYDEIDSFNDAPGIFKVHTGGWKTGKWGVMDGTGKWIAPPIFNNISYDYQDGLFAFYEDRNVSGDEFRDALYGVYDTLNQKILFEPQFTNINFMDNGLFCVETLDADANGTERIIDRNGNEVFPSDYSGIKYYCEPYVVHKGKHEDVRYGMINTDGSVILPCKYKIPWCRNGISYEDKTIIFIENGRQGMMDFDENILIPADNQEIFRLAGGLYGFKRKGLYGIVSKSGKIVLPAEYGTIELCRNNRIIVNGKNGVEAFEIKSVS